MIKNIKQITIIGTGKVAYQLSFFLKQKTFFHIGIYGRNKLKAKLVSEELELEEINSLHELPADSLVLICVSDSAVSTVINQIPDYLKIAYTSGSVELNDLPKRENLGVFYPLQTFSKNRKIDISTVPFLIEAENKTFEQTLYLLAKQISTNVIHATSEERYHLHIAGVLTNNFTNYLYYLSQQYLQKHKMDFNLLKPLMKETIEKLSILTPKEAQTGPASRGDAEIIQKHIASITDENTNRIYRLFSELIQKDFTK